jgi:hypothetical protein
MIKKRSIAIRKCFMSILLRSVTYCSPKPQNPNLINFERMPLKILLKKKMHNRTVSVTKTSNKGQ